MISIVIPVFNQLHYTKQCLESLRQTKTKARIVVVDNGSSDGTGDFLQAVPDIQLLRNEVNRGCAAGWNQGVRALPATWTVILNNDVLLSSGWLDRLVAFAEQNKLDIVSPGIREGELNYELESYASEFVQRMNKVVRHGVANGICFMVKNTVFESVGFFDENFRIGQFEDTDFFLRARNAGFKLATTGCAFIHHFGSVTQNSIRKEKTVRPYEAENRAYFRKKWKLNSGRRLLTRIQTKSAHNLARFCEQFRHGHSLNEKCINGKLHYY